MTLSDISRRGSPYMATEKGLHQYKTMIKQYMQGLKIREDKLAILFGLGIYSTKLTDIDIDMEYQIMNEIKKKLDVDMMDFYANQQVKHYLYQNGLIIDNPEYDEAYSNKVLEDMANE